SRPWTLVQALVRMAAAERRLGKVFAERGVPDVAIGFGAYVELPLIRWCHAHGVPCLIHEQNSVPGLANKVSSTQCKDVCVAFPAALGAFAKAKAKGAELVVTGNPVRRDVVRADAAAGRASLGIPDDARVLLVFGGSLGARHLNQAIAGLKDELLSREDLHVVHSTGAKCHEEALEALALTPEEGLRWHVLSYISNMGDVLACADLVVSRAGASSVAEISALAVPSVLVPYPFATADHQTTNAHYLVDEGAAILVPDDDLDDDSAFARPLLELLDDPERLAAMREAARGTGAERAAATLADRVEKAARA
ncbi:MAG: UDP-N-acetylglucosamine--N-acetylmuramyl-(pentapeptide) pyrophosphoryl-undecaprenol N-acetylglucosamine transferase, partial [Atopobiaceae bacterium]|nr:UDP-N-acetylglucosamine--N-acetylmuramyl-(pentapeptide) pyrophosphoryl-undecaprenol N-acetylglucosamine transferase [Atopobiaceae bacterium]